MPVPIIDKVTYGWDATNNRYQVAIDWRCDDTSDIILHYLDIAIDPNFVNYLIQNSLDFIPNNNNNSQSSVNQHTIEYLADLNQPVYIRINELRQGQPGQITPPGTGSGGLIAPKISSLSVSYT